jgi:hypothetical protein
LQGAELRGADLENVAFDESTTLLDGAQCVPDFDIIMIARFTDPGHPEFWRSDDPDSPAYYGIDEDVD